MLHKQDESKSGNDKNLLFEKKNEYIYCGQTLACNYKGDLIKEYYKWVTYKFNQNVYFTN